MPEKQQTPRLIDLTPSCLCLTRRIRKQAKATSVRNLVPEELDLVADLGFSS